MAFGRNIISVLAILPFIAAHPAAIHRVKPRDNIVIYDADVTAPTQIAKVVVYDDDNGVATLTATELVQVMPLSMANMAAPTPAPLITTTTTLTMVKTATITVNPAAKSATGNAPHTPAVVNPPVKNTDLFGVSYAPYRADHQCKSQDEINSDLHRFAGKFGVLRIYGTDCNQVPMIYKAAKANGFKLFLGVWDPAKLKDEANKIISGINGDWSIVHTISVGNELVNNGKASPQQMVGAVQAARPIFRAAGYMGPVVTVDTFMAVGSHPELCEASDYCAINAHAFFDSTITAAQAGNWLLGTVNHIKSALSSPKRVIVTETGWPTQGVTNGNAVPSLANQKAAINSIKQSFAANPSDIVLFSAFDDLWKEKTMATFNADQYWGIDGAVSNSDS